MSKFSNHLGTTGGPAWPVAIAALIVVVLAGLAMVPHREWLAPLAFGLGDLLIVAGLWYIFHDK